jgi:asparagine synthase (glutamine-hydrolysing)
MCGVAGYLRTGAGSASTGQALRSMATALVHRGPDDGGCWMDPEAGIGLAHRRLSILDLSPAGHQPMQSACGRYVIAFNGEIYNFLEVRSELETLNAAPPWRGHSDTEVVLAAVSHWGFVETLKKLTGMFAIALWDRLSRALYLARDRMGEKLWVVRKCLPLRFRT